MQKYISLSILFLLSPVLLYSQDQVDTLKSVEPSVVLPEAVVDMQPSRNSQVDQVMSKEAADLSYIRQDFAVDGISSILDNSLNQSSVTNSNAPELVVSFLNALESDNLFHSVDNSMVSDMMSTFAERVKNKVQGQMIHGLVANFLNALESDNLFHSVDNSMDNSMVSDMVLKFANRVQNQVQVQMTPEFVANLAHALEVDNFFHPVDNSIESDILPNFVKEKADNFHDKILRVLNTFAEKGFNIRKKSILQATNADSNSSWYGKIWNAKIVGYDGAGKYVVVGTAVAVTALVTAYYLGYLSKNVTVDQVDQMVLELIEQAQHDPNIVILQLPNILALCKDEEMQLQVLRDVFTHVEITPEIKKAFHL